MTSQYGPITQWLATMPKAELHLHIDGSLRPKRLLQLADKHGLTLPYHDEAALLASYDFADLQSFLDLYYLGASVLRDEEDFYWLMADYLEVCREQHIVHCEIMVEPQTYRPQGVDLATVLAGFEQAIAEARAGWGQSVKLILSFLRHLPEQECLDTLDAAEPHREAFCAIGLASSERDFPPSLFQRLYQEAAARGYQLAAHAGEEGPASFISDAIDVLGVTRIDHGVRALDDPALVQRLAVTRLPLTVCPLSNVRLRVYPDMTQHRLFELLDAGVCVTVNSDDPAYFGGDLLENFDALETSLAMTAAQATSLVKNSFEASYLDDEVKALMLGEVDNYLANHPIPA